VSPRRELSVGSFSVNVCPAYLLECSSVCSWLATVRSVGVTIRGRIRSFDRGSPPSGGVGSIWLNCAGRMDSPVQAAAAVAIGGQAQACGCVPSEA